MSIIYEAVERPLVMVLLENMNFPAHLHHSLEICCVKKGKCVVIVDDKPYKLTKGDIIIIAPNQKHEIICCSSEQDCKLFCVICPLNECGEYFSLLSNSKMENPCFRNKTISTDVYKALTRIFFTFRNKPQIARAYLQVVLASLLSKKSFTLNANENTVKNDVAESIIKYIQNNLNSELSIEILSKAVGINKYDVSRLINTTLKTNLPAYVNSLRLEKAAYMLCNSSLSVTDICLECGYNSLRNFNRQFKNMFCVSPRKYRANTKKAV